MPPLRRAERRPGRPVYNSPTKSNKIIQENRGLSKEDNEVDKVCICRALNGGRVSGCVQKVMNQTSMPLEGSSQSASAPKFNN